MRKFKVGDWVYGEDWCYGRIVAIEEDENVAYVEFQTQRGGGCLSFLFSELELAELPKKKKEEMETEEQNMNEEYIYFGTVDGGLVDHYDIIKMARIVSGKNIAINDFDAIREYAKTCKGIKKEVKKPSVKYLLERGEKVKAIQIYYRQHEGMGLKEAKDIIDKMEENLKQRTD